VVLLSPEKGTNDPWESEERIEKYVARRL
jgi:hypothetical protein